MFNSHRVEAVNSNLLQLIGAYNYLLFRGVYPPGPQGHYASPFHVEPHSQAKLNLNGAHLLRLITNTEEPSLTAAKVL